MTTPTFKERLLPSLGTFLALILIFPLVALSAAPFGWLIGLGLGGVALLFVLYLAIARATTIEVTNELRVGRLRIPLKALGEISIHTAEDARLERGPNLDSRAWLKIRGDIDPVVKIQVVDEADPTPYLLISSRRPKELASALGADFSSL